MNKISLQSFSKINIGLKVLRARQDGYHDIHTVFQELDFYDSILIKKKKKDVYLHRMLIGFPIIKLIYV